MGALSEQLSHNAVPSVEHFAHPELEPLLREVWEPVAPDGYGWTTAHPDRKSWEVAMALRALRDHGALRPEAEILGVGAGTESTLFVLTRHVARVFATDLYLDAAGWSHTATTAMLIDPRPFWSGAYDERRLVVQHMNALDLRYPAESFDGVFSSSSIEHFGDFEAVQQAMGEIYRVLRPGGVVSLSTEFRLDGPAPGLPGILMFDRAQLTDLIVGERDWALVGGELELLPSQSTVASSVPFSSAVADIENGARHWSAYPHLVLEQGRLLWTSVHLVLQKAE